jgi:hypothetical protein
MMLLRPSFQRRYISGGSFKKTVICRVRVVFTKTSLPAPWYQLIDLEVQPLPEKMLFANFSDEACLYRRKGKLFK